MKEGQCEWSVVHSRNEVGGDRGEGGRSQVLWGTEVSGKSFGLYQTCKEKPLRDFKQEINLM